jgi:nitroreductase
VQLKPSQDLESVIKGRRTHRKFSGSPIDKKILEEIALLSMYAPNHRRNEPWNYVIITSDQLEIFWHKILSGIDQAYFELGPDMIEKKKLSLKNLIKTLGGIIYVTSLKNELLSVERENYAATCCAIQNLLLLAHQHSLGSLWSTAAIFSYGSTMKALGVDINLESFVGAILMGHPTETPATPNFHPALHIRYWSPKNHHDHDNQEND